jgi:hypothetical protein
MMRRMFAYRHSPAEGPVVVCADLRSRKVPLCNPQLTRGLGLHKLDR